MRVRRFLAGAAAALAVSGTAAALAVSGTGVAFAQDAEDAAAVPTELLSVDATDATDGYLVVRSAEPPESVGAVVNGSPASIVSVAALSAAEAPTDTDQAVLFVLDNGDTARTDRVAQLDLLKDVVRDVVAAQPAGTRFGLITTGGGANLLLASKTDLEEVLGTLDRVQPAGRSALWDAVKEGASRLGDLDGVAVRSLVVVAATPEQESTVSFASARADVLAADVEVHTVAVSTGGVPAGELRALASVSGGTYQEATYEELSGLTDALEASIGGTYLVTISSPELQANGNLSLQIDETTIDAAYVPGSVTVGNALAVAVEPASEPSGPFTGSQGLLVAIVLATAAAALAAYAAVTIVYRPKSDLTSMLEVYARGAGGEVTTEVRNALLARAVQATESIAGKRGLLDRTEERLESADLPLRPAEALTFHAGLVLGVALLGLAATRNVLIALVLVLVAILAPPMVVDMKAKRRRKQFEAQLPDMLTLLASTLKAGYSFMQGVEAVSHEVDGPMGQELRRVVTEGQLGRPIEEALEASAERMQSVDFAWAVMAVRIQREVGGNLSELLMTVADTMVARNRLRGEVKALTAEGKMSAIVLGLLPLGLGMVMFAINPDYMGLLFSELLGQIMLALGVIGMLVGFLWMKKIITIDI